MLQFRRKGHSEESKFAPVTGTGEIQILAPVTKNTIPLAKSISITRIFAPTDLSPMSTAGVRYAINAARKFHAELVVYHVVTGTEVAAFARRRKTKGLVAAPSRGIIEAYASRLRGFIKRNFGADALSVKIKQRVDFGTPKKSIIEAAKSEKADLIVLTKSREGWFAKRFLRSVTEELIRQAPCPVLTIPANWMALREKLAA